MTYPKISIVTPSFNQGSYIEQTILSILDQNYPNLEYIIIDGGSNDNTVEILQKYADRLSFWVSEKDGGQSDAINKGIARCTGEIFNWINSDDYLQPNSLFIIAEEYLKNPFTALCGRVNVIDGTVFSHVRKTSFLEISSENSIANFNVNQEGTWWNMSAINLLKGVNIDFNYTMDLDLWIRALSVFPFDSFGMTDFILSNFRRHEEAKSTLNSKLSAFDDQFKKEEMVIFNQFISKSMNFNSYFEVFEIEELPYSINLNYSIEKEIQYKVTEFYIYKLLKQYYYSGNIKWAKKCLRLLNGFENSQFKNDINYIQKKIMLNSLLFWKK
jgi:glycosyltransferase involved in cell wall biosynthesis